MAWIVTALIVILAAWILIQIIRKGPVFWKELKDSGVLAGIAKALAFIIVLSLVATMITGCQGNRYLTDVSVHAGLQSTIKQSPQCESYASDNRTTSSIGLDVGLIESADGMNRVEFNYLHHSCAFGEDAKSYDGFGIGVRRYLFVR